MTASHLPSSTHRIVGSRRFSSSGRFFLLALFATLLTVSMSVAPAPTIATSNWVQLGDTFLGDNADDLAGRSVALSADGFTVAYGTYTLNDNNGTVTVYRWTGSTWVQKGQTITSSSTREVGFAVDISSDGDSLIVGARGISSNDLGQVELYRWDASNDQWDREMTYGFTVGQSFGSGVSISGNGLVFAAGYPDDDDGTGTPLGNVKVYDTAARNGDGDSRPDIYGEEDYDEIGYNSQSFDLDDDGSTIAIGSRENDGGGVDRGHVRVFDWDGTAWNQRGADIDGIEDSEVSGGAVAISADGNTVVIGAEENSTAGSDAGQARVFDWDGSAWVQRGDGINGVVADDEFGDSVAISADGNAIAAGSKRSDDNGTNSGHVRVFDWVDNRWQQRNQAIVGDPGDAMGGWLAMSASGGIVATSLDVADLRGGVRVYQSVTSASTPREQKPLGTPGIFLTVTGAVNDRQAGLPIIFGADRVRPGSPYSLTIRPSTASTQSGRVLSAGRIGSNGSFDATLALPRLSPGTYTLVLSAQGASGALLQLGNRFSVGQDGTLTLVTEERLQPTIR